MTTLRSQIETRNTRYRLNNAAVLCLQVPKRWAVQKEDGSFGDVEKPAIYITRVGDGKMGPFTMQYDASEDGVAEYIAFVDNWIKKNPGKARAAGLSKLNDERPAAKIHNWDNMTEEQIRSVIEATQIDLTWAMEYELQRPEKVRDLAGNEVPGGIRNEIIELIEEIYKNGFQSTIEQSEEAPVL